MQQGCRNTQGTSARSMPVPPGQPGEYNDMQEKVDRTLINDLTRKIANDDFPEWRVVRQAALADLMEKLFPTNGLGKGGQGAGQ